MNDGNGLDTTINNLGAAFAAAAPRKGKSAMKTKAASPQAAAPKPETAVAVAPISLTPRTPADIIAAMRTRRVSILGAKVEVDPQVTEALNLLAEGKAQLLVNRGVLDSQRRELAESIGKNLMSDGQLRGLIKQVQESIDAIDLEISQIDIDTAGLTQGNGVAMALAVIRQAAMRKQARELVDQTRSSPNPSEMTISRVFQGGLDAQLINKGQAGETSFNWNGGDWVSAIAGDSTAFGYVPVMKKITTEYTEQYQARRRKEQARIIPGDELEKLGATATSLSALIAGSSGHALVVMVAQDGKELGYALVELDQELLVVRRVSDRRLVSWLFADKDGSLREECILRFKQKGSVDHGHPGVRKSFDKVWAAEELLRKQASIVEARDAELAKFTRGKKVNTFDTDGLAKLLKPTSAGAGLWPIVFNWKVEPGRKGRVAPCGVVLEKKGSKVRVVALTAEAYWVNDLNDLMKVGEDEPEHTGFEAVENIPVLMQVLRAACEQAGISVPEALQA